MLVTLYTAISIDGYIAKTNGNTDWVSPVDGEFFEKAIEQCDCVVVGKRTFEQYKDELYPVSLKLNIVMTSQLPEPKTYENVEYLSHEPGKVIEYLKSKNCKNVIIVGGGKTNYSFMQAGVVDLLIVDVHPLALGSGIKLFEGGELANHFERVSVTPLADDLVQIIYKKLSI